MLNEVDLISYLTCQGGVPRGEERNLTRGELIRTNDMKRIEVPRYILLYLEESNTYYITIEID